MNTIFTIGYGNRNIDTFISLLENYKINIVVDVRSYPISRFNSNFNKKRLENNLCNSRIDYLYKGSELGGKPANQDFFLNGTLNYQSVGKLPAYKAAINDLIQIAENKNICLMCCELLPHSCHRKNLIGETLTKLNVRVLHINERGLIESQSKLSQLDLF